MPAHRVLSLTLILCVLVSGTLAPAASAVPSASSTTGRVLLASESRVPTHALRAAPPPDFVPAPLRAAADPAPHRQGQQGEGRGGPVHEPDWGKLPLSFVPNAGQADASVRFEVHSMGGTVSFAPDEVVLSLPAPQDAARHQPTLDERGNHVPKAQANANAPSSTAVRLRFDGAKTSPDIVSVDQLPGIANYYIGADPANWHTDLPTYAGITYQQLYPGIDLHYGGADGQLKSTYLIAPGTDPTRLR